MSKNKINLVEGMDVDEVLKTLERNYTNENCSTVDGLKIDFKEAWVHLRKSNTEPIIRIYTEAKSQEKAAGLAAQFAEEIKGLF